MKFMLKRSLGLAVGPQVAAVVVTGTFPASALAAPCADEVTGKAIYGAGGSAITPTLKNVAIALQNVPEKQRLTVLFHDPGACAGYDLWRVPDPTLEASFRYWNVDGVEHTCEAPQSVIEFAHMGNTPALCPGNVPLPSDARQFVGPVQTINLITHADSSQDKVSAEALYHIFGLGPGVEERQVAPWTNENAIYVRRTNSFVHQLVAGSVQVPAANFRLPEAQFLQRNQEIVDAIDIFGDAGNPEATLGYVSGSNAGAGEDAGQIKSLAYQHFEQSCALLPDSSPIRRDKLNVRTGQYWLWTPAWFFARVDGDGAPLNSHVGDLIHWFDGTEEPPDGADVQELIAQSGDVPLCAMHAIRSEGDLSPVQSFAPDAPCHGWYEYVATGSTAYQACDDTDECDGDGEVCRLGFCEAY